MLANLDKNSLPPLMETLLCKPIQQFSMSTHAMSVLAKLATARTKLMEIHLCTWQNDVVVQNILLHWVLDNLDAVVALLQQRTKAFGLACVLKYDKGAKSCYDEFKG